MSSLYGNRFMEFKKFFYRFFFKNTGKNVSTFDESFNEDNVLDEQGVELAPTDVHDCLTIETANKWIQMKQTDELSQIALFHSKSEAEELETSGLVYDSEGKPFTNADLKFKDKITLYDLQFDAAGHISKITPHIYTVPDLSYTTLTKDQLNTLFNNLKQNTSESIT